MQPPGAVRTRLLAEDRASFRGLRNRLDLTNAGRRVKGTGRSVLWNQGAHRQEDRFGGAGDGLVLQLLDGAPQGRLGLGAVGNAQDSLDRGRPDVFPDPDQFLEQLLAGTEPRELDRDARPASSPTDG